MKKKYDTNPLDDTILRQAEAARGNSDFGAPPHALPPPHAQQQQSHAVYEAPTARFEPDARRFAEAPPAAIPPLFHEADLNQPYQSIFARAQPPQNAAPQSISSAAQAIVLPPTERRVLGLSLPEKWAMVLPYLPFTIGAIIAVVTLFFAARSETRVRFHAAQALALHLASWIVGIMLSFVGGIAFFGNTPAKIFQAVVFVYFVVSIARVWRGKANHIEMLDDVTDFLNEKIKPRK